MRGKGVARECEACHQKHKKCPCFLGSLFLQLLLMILLLFSCCFVVVVIGYCFVVVDVVWLSETMIFCSAFWTHLIVFQNQDNLECLFLLFCVDC